MSEFSCEVVRVKIIEHPNADAIEIAKIGDYQSIVRKGQLKDGDLAVYIPEQAVVPEWLLRQMGMYDEVKGKGGLAGSGGNRVKAIKLRGVLSQGLILPGFSTSVMDVAVLSVTGPSADDATGGDRIQCFNEGEDVAEFLGIVKYEPALPSHMRGKAIGVDLHATAKYDFENIKKHPSLFQDGEEVVITEKLHGTLLMICVVPEQDANEKYYKGRVAISSKGLGGRGIVLDHTDETNIYAQTVMQNGLLDAVLELFEDGTTQENMPYFVFGEVYGKTLGGKDVQTGFAYGANKLKFRAFDMCAGTRGNAEYVPWDMFTEGCSLMGIETVPVLYVGPFSREVLALHTDGPTTIPGGLNIREGVVVKAADASVHPAYGRKIAKSVSEAYLLRKGETTEFA